MTIDPHCQQAVDTFTRFLTSTSKIISGVFRKGAYGAPPPKLGKQA